MNNNISAMLTKHYDTSSKTDNQEEELSEILSRRSTYEDRLKKLSIKETHIQSLSINITEIIPNYHLMKTALTN